MPPNALSEVDVDPLDAEEQVDHAVLSALVDRELFELTEIRGHEWNPLTYNPGPLLHDLIARPFAPAEVRLASLAGRLAAVPDALATARATLRDMPRIHAETAVGQLAGTVALVRDELPALLAEVPGLRSRSNRPPVRRSRSLDEFAEWLRAGLRDDQRAGARPDGWGAGSGRPGSGTPWTPSSPPGQVLERAEANLERVTEEIRAAAVELVGGPADRRDGTPRRWTGSPSSIRTTTPLWSWLG